MNFYVRERVDESENENPIIQASIEIRNERGEITTVPIITEWFIGDEQDVRMVEVFIDRARQIAKNNGWQLICDVDPDDYS